MNILLFLSQSKPGFPFGETLSISTLGPSSRLPEKIYLSVYVIRYINFDVINTTGVSLSACYIIWQ